MKKLVFAVASALTLAAPTTFAQSYERDYYRDNYRADRYDDRRDRRDDFARVIESRPVYDAANAKSECINTRTGAYEEVREENRHRIGKGAAIGAVAGGVLGHQVDKGG